MSRTKGKAGDKNNEKVIKQCQPDSSVIRLALLARSTCAENESERLAANKNHQSCSAAKTIDSFNIPTSFLLCTSESHAILLRTAGGGGEDQPADQRTNELFLYRCKLFVM